MRSLIAYCVLFLVFEANGQEDITCKGRVRVNGAGTYTPHLLFGAASARYSAKRIQGAAVSVDFDYQRRSSAFGIQRLTGEKLKSDPVVFATTSSEISDNDRIKHPKLKSFPVMAAALVILYNLPEARKSNQSLVLGTKTLVKIYDGTIKYWDNEEIVELNPQIKFSHKKIRVVARSDVSGQTKILTDALGKFDPWWSLRFGYAFSSPDFVDNKCCNSTRWPQGVVEFFADQWAGMIGILNSIDYTIGYEALANVARFKTPYARLVNQAGKITEPSTSAIQAAMDYHLFRSSMLVFSLNNALVADAYPIAGFIYMIVNSSTAKGVDCCQMREFSGFVTYLIDDIRREQNSYIETSLVALSQQMSDKVKENVLKTLRCGNGKPYEQYLATLEGRFEWQSYHYVSIFFTIVILVLGSTGGAYVYKLRKEQLSNENDWLLVFRVKIINNRNRISTLMRGSRRTSGQRTSAMEPSGPSRSDPSPLPGAPHHEPSPTPSTQTKRTKRRTEGRDSIFSNHSKMRYNLLIISNSSAPNPKSLAFSSNLMAGSEMHELNFLHDLGEMEGNSVMLQDLGLSFPLTWNRETRKMVSKLRHDISHTNVLGLHGITVIDGTNYAVVQNAPKGTLHYVLKNTRFELTDSIKFNLALDAAEGIAYLHRNGVMHGLLSSLTCYVDGSWTIKIASWERFSLYFLENPKEFNSEISFRVPEDEKTTIKLLYLDPELYCAKRYYFDVYSFGMLLVEIFSGKIPFDKEIRDGATLVELLENKFFNYSLIPDLNAGSIPFSIQDLINSCCGNPTMRPTMSQICAHIDKIKPTPKGIVDVMMDTIENYTELLEQKVNQRTDQLNAATQRMQELLHEVLPVEIATKLLKGEQTEPEFFDCVTVYFSDICGFVDISNKSTPLEVMQFLNDLWALFDSVIEQHDVYKTDTIGDAYMVCSGLPKRNGVNHCKQICDLALNLLTKCINFKIRHMPSESLKIRIGINSGPVTTGVVGSKMPQYCVFGDTVNTAARMESTSFPFKIQVSEKTNELIKIHFPIYETKLRGEVQVKGKGTMKTYWLVPPRNHVVYKNHDYIL